MTATSTSPSDDADAGDDLAGMLLIATPGMTDPRFRRSVIYLCSYSTQGAMGLVVNRVASDISFVDVVGQLGIEVAERAAEVDVHVGGPVETSRGFVLHSTDFTHADSMAVDESRALSATIDVLAAIASGGGPRRRMFALGYAGWAAGQLDQEIQANGWLLVPADDDLVFGADHATKWDRALFKIGVDPSLLSGVAGHA
ncbi:MAG: YqgE/AlgH family protein [Geminicoccaceae bacterium]|nr:YqgE/AlgH family protein [Geminicoccaceae bacterium]